MILAIAPTEKEALAISRRGVDGLIRRTKHIHTYDHLVLSEAECERAIGPLNAILASHRGDGRRRRRRAGADHRAASPRVLETGSSITSRCRCRPAT